MKTKKIGAALLSAAVVAGALSGATAQAQDKEFTIAVSIPAATHGWTGGVVYHAQEAEKQLEAAFPNIDVIVSTASSATAQVSSLEDLSATNDLDAPGYPAIHLRRADRSGGAGCLERDFHHGRPTVACRTRRFRTYMSPVTTLLSARTRPNGWSRNLMEKARLSYCVGYPTVIDDERIQGFTKVIDQSNIEILDIQYANWNQDEAFTLMQDYLAQYPNIDAVWGKRRRHAAWCA